MGDDEAIQYDVCAYCSLAIFTIWDQVFVCKVWVTQGAGRSYCRARRKIDNIGLGESSGHVPKHGVKRGRAKSPATSVLSP